MAHSRKTIRIPGYVGNAISAVDCTQLDLGYETRFGTLYPTILHIQGVHGPDFFRDEARNKTVLKEHKDASPGYPPLPPIFLLSQV